jgi:SAM-dependent methyltransferase
MMNGQRGGAPASDFWEAKYQRDGHTGYDDPRIYRYDQPLRVRRVRRELARLFPGGLRGRRGLDVGCGTGDFMALLLDAGCGSVQGIDVSPGVVAAARRRFAAAGDRVRLEVAALPGAALGRDRFDVITCVTVLQHVVDDDEAVAAVRAMGQALTPQGCLVVLEIAPERPVPALQPGVLRERTRAQWEALFAAAGLEVEQPPGVYTPLGFSAVQLWLPALLRRLVRRGADGRGDGGQGGGRLRAVYDAVRAVTLWLTRPVDVAVDLRLPARLAYYRLFVLRRRGA